MTSFFLATFTLARQSFRDFLRERILYNIFFVSVFLLFFGYLAALLVFGHQDRVMLHFGTMVNAISVFFVAAGAGARVLRSEIEQRICYLPLSRPISRVSYFYGKWLGIAAFTFLNLALLSAVLGAGLHVTGGHISVAFFQSAFLIWIESLLVSALAITVSLFLRQGLTAMVCMAYLFLAHNHEQMDFLKKQGSDETGVFTFLKMLTPDAQVLLMDTRVYYELPLSGFELFQRTGYGLLWTFIFLLIGNAFFYRRNL